LNNAQGSAGSSRTYAANFTAGIPTALGTVLHLEINSSRTNNSSSQVVHRTAIQFGGTAYLDTGNIAVLATGNATDAYQRKLQRTIVLTVSGWVDFSLGSRIGTVAAATDIIFKTNENVGQAATGSDLADVERMRITSTGNVIMPTSLARLGIGTDNPAFSGLNIYTTDEIINMKSTRSEKPEIKIGWSGEAAENVSWFEVDGNQTGFLYGRKYTTGTIANSNAGWKFYKNDNAVGIALVGSSGNVGIGTAAPGHLFHVVNASNNNNGAFSIKAGTSSIGGPHETTFRQRATSSTDRNLQIESSPYAGANRIAHWIHLNSAGNGWNDILAIRGDGRVGIGTNNPSYDFEVTSSYVKFGNIKFNSGFAAMPADASTGINMIGGDAGGGVLFVVSFHNGSADSTGLKMCLLRKRNSGTWSQSSNNTHFISSLVAGSTQDGTLSFSVSNNILRYRYAQGGNSHFYVFDFDG